MRGRQKSGAPAGLAAVRIVLAREEDDERGEIAVFAAQPITEPGAETRPAGKLVAGKARSQVVVPVAGRRTALAELKLEPSQ